MKKLFLLFTVFICLHCFAQNAPNSFYIKFISSKLDSINKNNNLNSYSKIYVVGGKQVWIRDGSGSINDGFTYFPCDGQGPFHLVFDLYYNNPFIHLPDATFYAGDSAIINLDNGKFTILNRKYNEYEENFSSHLSHFMNDKKITQDGSLVYWKDVHKAYDIDKEFVEHCHSEKLISDSFYHSYLAILPYELNMALLVSGKLLVLRDIKIAPDSLLACPPFTDAFFYSSNYDLGRYLQYVNEYIDHVVLANRRDISNAAYYTFINTELKGKLRERLVYYYLSGNNIKQDSSYLDKFNNFKTISTDTTYINPIERKIKENQ